MNITVTPEAAKYIREHLKITSPIRILLEKSGCAGVSFKFRLVPVTQDDDVVTVSSGITVVVSRGMSADLDGTVVSVADDHLGKSLTIENSKYTPSCGCGKSYTKNPVE